MVSSKKITLEDISDWNNLIKESQTATFFQTKEWLTLWVKHWGKNTKVFIYAVYDGDSLVGIVPFGIKGKINFLGVPDPSGPASLSDFGDVIIKSGRESEVWEAVLKRIKDLKLRIELNYIREESPSFKILQGLGGRAEVMEVSPVINLPKTWDEYLASLDRHDRHEIRRKMRKIEAENVIKVCDEITPNNIDDFFRLMASSSEEKSKFLSGDMRKFISEVIVQLAPKKLLTLCLLRYNNENIAAIYLLFQNNETLLYNSGFEPKYYHLSPGLILNVYAIKQAIEEGKRRFNFLRGGEKYKFDLGGKQKNLYKFIF